MPISSILGANTERPRVSSPAHDILRVRADAIALQLPHVAPRARAEWLEELQRYERDCGCGTGAIGAVTILMSLTAWQIASITTLSLKSAAAAFVEIIVLTAVGGVVGKLIGLGRARLRFRRATERLRAQYPTASTDLQASSTRDRLSPTEG